jgi:nucleotide-binding universal stress UspA family protein
MNGTIAAGIGGTGAWRALAWATDQAGRTGARLALVHVCAPGSPLDRMTGDPTVAEVELIDPPLARAYTHARGRLGAWRTVLKIRGGDPTQRLVDASAGVRLLVIGDGEGGHTVRRVVRHAHCPVVVARPSTPAAQTPLAGHVVVGVDHSAAGQAALGLAFGYADDHRLPLTAVHVSAPGEHTGPDLLAAELAPWVEKYPSVTVHRAVRTGSVADELVTAALGAALLVVGDKRRGVIGRARTGDVPMTVATEAPAPVAVVPLEQREGEPW